MNDISRLEIWSRLGRKEQSAFRGTAILQEFYGSIFIVMKDHSQHTLLFKHHESCMQSGPIHEMAKEEGVAIRNIGAKEKVDVRSLRRK